jgi:hypothetical protein
MRLPIIICLIALTCVTGCSKSRKEAYTSETYYEMTESRNWYTLCITKSPKYTEVVVSIPIDDKVEPAFLITRHLFVRNGEAYTPKKVRTVNIAVYEAADARHQKILDNLFNFFRGLALLGTLCMVVGIFLFALKFKFPMLPSIWDEFLLYGGVATCVGMLGAWYVEQFILISLCGGGALIAAAGYSLIRHYRKEKKLIESNGELLVNSLAVGELVHTVEVLKLTLGTRWDEVKGNLMQAPETKALVDKFQAMEANKVETPDAIS